MNYRYGIRLRFIILVLESHGTIHDTMLSSIADSASYGESVRNGTSVSTWLRPRTIKTGTRCRWQSITCPRPKRRGQHCLTVSSGHCPGIVPSGIHTFLHSRSASRLYGDLGGSLVGKNLSRFCPTWYTYIVNIVILPVKCMETWWNYPEFVPCVQKPSPNCPPLRISVHRLGSG